MPPFKNNIILFILVSVISTGIALALYDFFLERHEQERRQEIIQEINTGIEKKRLEDRRAAVAKAVDQERLRQGIASAGILRAGITEYFAVNGKMPDSLIDLGYDHDWSPSNVLKSIDVQTGGIIVLRFAPQPFGEVVFIPDSTVDSIRGWDCESRDFPSIEQIADCRFTGIP